MRRGVVLLISCALGALVSQLNPHHRKKRAWVTMANVLPGKKGQDKLPNLAHAVTFIARQLKERGSKYPYVVFTNHVHAFTPLLAESIRSC